MEGLFIKVLDMSINASYLIAVVLLVRVLLSVNTQKIYLYSVGTCLYPSCHAI